MEDEGPEDEGPLLYLVVTFVVILLVCCIFEAVILGMAYFYADKVECNLLWCTFTTTRSSTSQWTDTSENIITTRTSNSLCYENGVEVNCSLLKNMEEIKWPKEP